MRPYTVHITEEMVKEGSLAVRRQLQSKNPEEVDILYQDTTLPAEAVLFPIHHKVEVDYPTYVERLVKATSLGIPLTDRFLTKLGKTYKKEKKLESLYENWTLFGEIKGCTRATPQEIDSVSALFLADKHFHGRVPGIVEGIAIAKKKYKIPEALITQRFSIPVVNELRKQGLSQVECALLYTVLSKPYMDKLMAHPEIALQVSHLLSKAFEEKNKACQEAAKWVCNHADTREEIRNKVEKYASFFSLTVNTTVEEVESFLFNSKALREVELLEKNYKKTGFKVSNCVCELRKTTVETDHFRAYIMEGNDPRQVMLGYETHCCQKREDVGESAMMHGLLNEKAGFWRLENKNTGKTLAQAEVWEEDENTLVFDNIEFANDTDINYYKEAIKQWLLASPYPNIKMGSGYNQLASSQLRHCGRPAKPPVTPYEIYVLSYEKDGGIPDYIQRTAPNKREDDDDKMWELPSPEKAAKYLARGRIDYYDYIYCDSERVTLWMKEDGRLEPFFAQAENLEASYDETRDQEEEYEEE